jgi:hypothetical protein
MKAGIFWIVTTALAVAQEGPDFSKPIPARPGAPIRWVADYSYSAERSPGARRPVRLTVDFTKTATRVVKTLVGGQTEEQWFAEGVEFRRVPNVNEPVVLAPEDSPDPQTPDYVRVFFPKLGWVGERSYRGKEKKFGQEVFVFEAPYGTASTQRAYISAATLLPVALEFPSLVIRYAFSPAEPVELPADLRTALETYRGQVRAMRKPGGGK